MAAYILSSLLSQKRERVVDFYEITLVHFSSCIFLLTIINTMDYDFQAPQYVDFNNADQDEGVDQWYVEKRWKNASFKGLTTESPAV